MAYTPELSSESSCTLRRIAWALEVPMTEAIEMVFEYIPQILDKNKVCEGCKDKTRCDSCGFNNNEHSESHMSSYEIEKGGLNNAQDHDHAREGL